MNKKGFTLIELLAVIVILGIILVIAIPSISKAILNSRKNAYVATANEFADGLRLKTLTDPSILPSSSTPTYYGIEEIKLEKGSNTKSPFGKNYVEDNLTKSRVCVAYDDTNKDYIYSICLVDEGNNRICNIDENNTYAPIAIKTVTKDSVVVGVTDGSGTVTTTKLPAGLTKGTAVYINPDTASVCNASSAVSTAGTKTGCMKWYVYKDNGNGTYQLILDHNTTALVTWNSSGSNASMKEVAAALTNDTSSWDSSLNARLITAVEVAETTGNPTFSGATSTYDKWFYLDSNNQTQVANLTTKSNYAWLFDYTLDCINYGCNVSDSSNYGYWTSTPVSSNIDFAWQVGRRSKLDYGDVDAGSYYGVRPVITF